jgi:hypothetical protein
MAIKSKADKDDTAPITTDAGAREPAAVPGLHAREVPERRAGEVGSPYQGRQSYPGA